MLDHLHSLGRLTASIYIDFVCRCRLLTSQISQISRKLAVVVLRQTMAETKGREPTDDEDEFVIAMEASEPKLTSRGGAPPLKVGLDMKGIDTERTDLDALGVQEQSVLVNGTCLTITNPFLDSLIVLVRSGDI